MPAPSRRSKQSGAIARLPSSRLPLGTPQLPDRSQTTSRATNRSISAASSHITSASDSTPGLLEADPATDTPHDAQLAMSTAEAKLQRQTERIQQAEAALTKGPQLERNRPQSRATSKSILVPRPSDSFSNPARSRTTSGSDGGVAVETRVNSYRSESSVPANLYMNTPRDGLWAAAAGAVPMERQDSVIDDVGFQVYNGRRGSKKSELGAYEDKPEMKQTTVEATVDQREILTVFATPLPGLDFLAGQQGWRNGQVQFIQHPNGDVSAHMWSPQRYQWDNIGHFSNIRKKIEGQLAGDHLKGETAYQKLQQNTLAYFRTIAKQREAATTGVDFGQTEIQQLLPEPNQAKQTVPSTKKLNASTPAFAQGARDFGTAAQKAPEVTSQPQLSRPRPQPIQPSEEHPFYTVPQGSRSFDHFTQPSPSPKQVLRAEDPFTTTAHRYAYPQLGPEYNGGTVAGPARKPVSMGPPSVEHRHTSYGIYQPTATPAVPEFTTTYKPLPASRTSSSEDAGLGFGSQYYARPNISSMPSFPPPRVAGTGPEVDRRHRSIASLDSLRGKPATPREVLRENLFKISDHAVERSLSRENLQNLNNAVMEHDRGRPPRRTVLHDPFQAEDKSGSEGYDLSSVPRRSGSELHNSVVRMATRTAVYPSNSLPLTDSQPFKNTPLPPVDAEESHLINSVPDLMDDDYPTPASRAHSNSYGFNADPRTSLSMPSLFRQSTMSPDEELEDWWSSGSKFTRQEEFYQSLAALSRPIESNASTPGRTFALALARCPTTSTHEIATAGEVLTRVLIPVYENLASYVEGPHAGRRDYWSRWSQAPEWCIDRGPNGNKSFYDDTARIGRDSRYRSMDGGMRLAGVAVPASLERRLGLQ